MLHGAVQPFSFLFFCGGLRLGFGFYCCGGGALIPQGCSPWNLGHFLLVQKVTKDTLKRRGIAIYLRAKSLASLGCAPKRACGRSPLSLKNLISLNRQRRGLRAPSLIFPGDIVRKSFRKKQSKKINHASTECGQGPQSAEIDTMPIEKGPTHAPIECGPKGRRAPHQTRKSISAEGHTVPPAERQRRKRGKACERRSNFKYDL